MLVMYHLLIEKERVSDTLEKMNITVSTRNSSKEKSKISSYYYKGNYLISVAFHTQRPYIVKLTTDSWQDQDIPMTYVHVHVLYM